MSEKKKRVLSGVQPTGKLHIGNYVGAISQWAANQHLYDNLFCVVDLHAITIPERIEPAALREKTREVAALYVACGIDPEQSTIFVQSDVSAHAELAWLLTCTTPLGWLHRMTQFKSKSEALESVGTGLLTYPVLQAADILIYSADLVPVGEDQKQHIELARDVAQRFNALFGEVFVLPDPLIRKSGARIMGLDDPEQKMSKSVGQQVVGHSIGLLDPPKKVKKAIMRAQTDSGRVFRIEEAEAGVRNLLTLHHVLSDEPYDSIAARFEDGDKGYGHLKLELVDLVESRLGPVREAYARIRADEAQLDALLDRGAERARDLAADVLRRAYEAAGLGR